MADSSSLESSEDRFSEANSSSLEGSGEKPEVPRPARKAEEPLII